MKTLMFLLIPILAIIAICCSQIDDSVKLEENGLTKDINSIFKPDVINEYLNLGFTINSGTNPPELNGTYLITPFILTNSNISGDAIGGKYSDLTLTFNDFNLEKLTVTVSITEGSNSTETYSGFLVGSGSLFTVFFEELKSSGIKLGIAMSGSINSTGIYNFIFALYMLDNNDLPGKIQNGSCRTFKDGDYNAELIELAARYNQNFPMGKIGIDGIN